MIVKGGRGSGQTTQLFLEILADTEDCLLFIKSSKTACKEFTQLAGKLITAVRGQTVELIDGRKITFMEPTEENYDYRTSFRGRVAYDFSAIGSEIWHKTFVDFGMR